MDYILTGDEKFVSKVLQENKYRVHKGEVKFIPVNPVNVGALIADDKFVSVQETEDSKDLTFKDEKKPRKRNKKSE